MDGLLFCAETDTPRQGTGRLMEYAQTNFDQILFWFHVPALGAAGNSITVRCGTGAITTQTIPAVGTPRSIWITAPWGGAGWQEIYWTIAQATIDGVAIWALPRSTLVETDGDDVIESGDPTNLQGGLNEGNVIISTGGSTYHVPGVAETLEQGYDNSRPTAWQCSAMSNTQSQVGAGIAVWAQCGTIGPFFSHRAQTWRPTDTSQAYRCYVYCSSAGGGNSTWRLRGTGVPSTATYGPAVIGGAGWTNVDGLLIDSTADDVVYFETASDAGTTLTVNDITIKRYTP